jgi:hypothetical protein
MDPTRGPKSPSSDVTQKSPKPDSPHKSTGAKVVHALKQGVKKASATAYGQPAFEGTPAGMSGAPPAAHPEHVKKLDHRRSDE